jgi:4-hydroxy-tetrahydrodipicolinate synthase
LHPDADGCYEYYKALSQAVEIPICIQNFNGPVGTPMSSALIGRMCRELELVDYVKEERIPEPPLITTTLAAAGDACKGVFGGQGAMHVIEEHRRGSHGSMPASQITDLHAAVWNLLDAGDEAGARKLFNQFLPLISFERVYGVAAYKEIMVRRGIFKTNLSRSPGKSLDEMALVELDALWSGIEPLFRV